MSWKSLATRETPPFLVALFFGALAWSLTHWADRLSQAPIIEYTITVDTTSANMQIDLENLSENKAFSGLEFTLLEPGPSEHILAAELIPSMPAYEGSVPPEISRQSAVFTIEKFQPGWKFGIRIKKTPAARLTFQLTKSAQTVRLVQPSFETWLIRHQNQLVLGLLFLWALTTISLLRLGKNYEVPERRTVSTSRFCHLRSASSLRGMPTARRGHDHGHGS